MPKSLGVIEVDAVCAQIDADFTGSNSNSTWYVNVPRPPYLGCDGQFTTTVSGTCGVCWRTATRKRLPSLLTA